MIIIIFVSILMNLLKLLFYLILMAINLIKLIMKNYKIQKKFQFNLICFIYRMNYYQCLRATKLVICKIPN